MDKRVSIVIPVYNVSEYIERCIASVIAQTYQNIECIVVDDCTPDDSIEKSKVLTDTYQGPITFRYIKHEKNGGLSASRNTGTRAAIGEYVYYLDSDDEITPDCIELLVSASESHPGVELVQGNVKAVSEDGGKCFNYDIRTFSLPEEFTANRDIRLAYYKAGAKWPVNAWNKLIKKDFIVENNLFYKEGVYHEDEHWMYFAVKKLQSMVLVSDFTYVHYRRAGSIMTSDNFDRRAKDFYSILNDFIEGIDKEYRREQLGLIVRKFCPYYRRASEKREYKEMFWKLVKMGVANFEVKMVLRLLRSHMSAKKFLYSKK